MRFSGARAGVDSGQRRPRPLSPWVNVAALIYVAALAMVTLLPIHWTLGLVKWPSNPEPQLVPFDDILPPFRNSPVEALAELFGNVLLFTPFGFLLPLFVAAIRRWWRVRSARASRWASSCTSSPGRVYARPVSTTCC